MVLKYSCTFVHLTGGNYFGTGWKGREKGEEEEEKEECFRSSWGGGDSIKIKVASSDVGRIIGTMCSMSATLCVIHWLHLAL